MSFGRFLGADHEALTVTLVDGSVWELVNSREIIKATTWQPTAELILREMTDGLCEITNTSTSETITVRRRG